MKNLKKVTVRILVIILTVISLTACTNSGQPDKSFLQQSTESIGTVLTGNTDLTDGMASETLSEDYLENMYTARGLSPMIIASMSEEALTQKLSNPKVSP